MMNLLLSFILTDPQLLAVFILLIGLLMIGIAIISIIFCNPFFNDEDRLVRFVCWIVLWDLVKVGEINLSDFILLFIGFLLAELLFHEVLKRVGGKGRGSTNI